MRKKHILYMVILIILIFLIFDNVFNLAGNNQCSFNGQNYNEFDKHPIEYCECRGFSDGYDDEIWVCKN